MSPQELADLDAAVARAEGWEHLGAIGTDAPNDAGKPFCRSGCNDWWLSPAGYAVCRPCSSIPMPSTDPAEAMRLLEKYKLDLAYGHESRMWASWRAVEKHYVQGETACIAICRAVVTRCNLCAQE